MRLKRVVILTAAAFTGAALVFTANAVQPTIAKAGGLGDFYTYKTCYPVRYGDRLTSLKGVLSNYDAGNFTKQRYHHGVKITASGWYLATAPLYNDESWPITKSEIWDAAGWSGYKWDGYQDFSYAAGRHTVTFIFSNGKISARCSITT